jgi:hypothetical protein
MSKTQWYAKPGYVLVALALVLSLWVVAVPLAGTVEAVFPGGTHYYVATTGSDANNGTSWAWAWKTITHAVETGATNPGDVIHVADGVYDPANGENFPIDFNTSGVTLIGAGGDTSTIDANNQERNILNILDDGVSISGFELKNASATWWGSTGNGIYIADVVDCHISNIEIHHLTQGGNPSAAREPAGIFMEEWADNNTFSSIEIYDINSDYQPRGIWCHNCSGNQFTDINIHDIQNTNGWANSCAYGIHLSSSSGNMFEEITINSITGGNWSEGIQLSWSHNNTFGDLSISDIYGETYVYGILLLESSDNTFGSSSEIWNINAEFGCAKGVAMEPEYDTSAGSNRNTFTSFDIHDTCYAFCIDKSDDNVITKSNIHDNVEGVHICSEPSTSEGNKVNCNNIYRNTDYGVSKAYSPPVDATGNWWGDAHGPSLSPGNGDKINDTDTVLYDPYLSLQFPYCGQCGGALPPPPSAVPTVNHWGIVALITLFAGLLVWRVRRRRLAS